MGEEIVYLSFNQDYSSLNVGTSHGWSLISMSTAEVLEKVHEAKTSAVLEVERLFSSSLVAVASLENPRKLKVYHFKKNNEICNYGYTSTVLAVKINRARLVVCIDNFLYIHNIRDMKCLHTIKDTPLNPRGILALSGNADNSYLAYPGSSSTGQVQVFDAFNLQAKLVIYAHATAIHAMAFNQTGTKLATASEKGTVIRVFSTSDGTRLFEFRRGMKRCASIYSIAFSPDDVFLATSSNTETVHIFRLQPPAEVKDETTNTWMEWVKGALPTQVADVWGQGRAFATITTPFQGVQSVVAVAPMSSSDGVNLKVLVASYDGFLYIYGLNTAEGGECPLLKQHRLTADAELRRSPATPGTASYAGVVKGRSPQSMSDSDKIAEMKIAIAPSHPTDDVEYPTFP